MEPKRISSQEKEQGRWLLGASGLLLLIPLASIVAFLNLVDDKTVPGGREVGIPALRPRTIESPRVGAKSGTGDKDVRRVEASPRSPDSPGTKISPERSDGVTSSPTLAETDAAHLERFDENARTFDARLAAFDAEHQAVDVSASDHLQGALLAALKQLHPTVEVSATCTTSVCVVELTSPEPVGTMIAKIAPWLRQRTRASTGDPVSAGDKNSMRLAFEKVDSFIEF